MDYSDVKTAINNGITDNGNQEIIGAVLRPILIAIVDLMQELVGDQHPVAMSVIDFITNISVGGLNYTRARIARTIPPGLQGGFVPTSCGCNTIAFWQFS